MFSSSMALDSSQKEPRVRVSETPRNDGLSLMSFNKHRHKVKVFKALDYRRRYVLRRDMGMDKVESLCNMDLVGRLEYVRMVKEGLVN